MKKIVTLSLVLGAFSLAPSLTNGQRWITCHSDVVDAQMDAEAAWYFDIAHGTRTYTGLMFNDCRQAAVNGYALAMTQAEELACAF